MENKAERWCMGDSAPLAKLWFQIPNTAALLICKYGATNANSSSGRKKKKKREPSSFLGFYLSEISAGRDCKMLYILSVAKRQLLPESFWLLLIIRCLSKEKKKKKLHRFRITCWAYLGFSWEPQKKSWHSCTPPPSIPPPSLSPTAGFILSAGTMTGEEKGMLSPLAGQHRKNIHANETFLMSPGLKWHFYDMKSRGNKTQLCLVALARTKETLHLWLLHSISRLETLYSVYLQT